MKLFLDTTQKDTVIIALDKKRFISDARVHKSQQLLPFIEEIFKKESLELTAITEIDINIS